MANLEAARFDGSRIANLLKALELLKGFDLSKLFELVKLVSQFPALTSDPKSEAGIVERATLGLKIAHAFAEMTATTADDSVVAFVDKVLGNPDTLAWLAKIVAGLLAKGAPADPQALHASLLEVFAEIKPA